VELPTSGSAGLSSSRQVVLVKQGSQSSRLELEPAATDYFLHSFLRHSARDLCSCRCWLVGHLQE
jgi:hypothetical protein